MEGDEKREPTLAEVVEEVRKSRDEVIANMEVSGLTAWFGVLAIGLAIWLFGMGGLTEVLVRGGQVWWGYPVLVADGLGVMVYAVLGRRRAKKRIWDKWCGGGGKSQI